MASTRGLSASEAATSRLPDDVASGDSVILSFFQIAMDGTDKQTLMATGKFELALQVGRVAKGGGEKGIAIESWTAQRK